MVSCLSQTKCRVKAPPTNRPRKLYHGIQCDSNSPSLNNAVLTILSAREYLAQDAHAEEEGAPELEQEHLQEVLVFEAQAAKARGVGAEEGRLAYYEVAHDDADVGADYLEAYDH